MIKLTKLNNEEVVINSNQIQAIEIIPESKIIFISKDYLIVKESADEIIGKVIDFNKKIYDYHKRTKRQKRKKWCTAINKIRQD